jgi:hypothetical protein
MNLNRDNNVSYRIQLIPSVFTNWKSTFSTIYVHIMYLNLGLRHRLKIGLEHRPNCG